MVINVTHSASLAQLPFPTPEQFMAFLTQQIEGQREETTLHRKMEKMDRSGGDDVTWKGGQTRWMKIGDGTSLFILETESL